MYRDKTTIELYVKPKTMKNYLLINHEKNVFWRRGSGERTKYVGFSSPLLCCFRPLDR